MLIFVAFCWTDIWDIEFQPKVCSPRAVDKIKTVQSTPAPQDISHAAEVIHWTTSPPDLANVFCPSISVRYCKRRQSGLWVGNKRKCFKRWRHFSFVATIHSFWYVMPCPKELEWLSLIEEMMDRSIQNVINLHPDHLEQLKRTTHSWRRRDLQ